MYHGHGSNLNSDLGPASWFIVSEKNGYLISKGLIPLPKSERAKFEKDGKALAKFDEKLLNKK